MNRIGLALLTLTLVAPAWADGVKAPATPTLDLNLPTQPYVPFVPPAHSSSTPDTGWSMPAPSADTARRDSDLNDSKPHVWGSVTTGVGYSKAFGTTTWEGANVNMTKFFGSAEHPFALTIGVSTTHVRNLGNGRWPYAWGRQEP